MSEFLLDIVNFWIAETIVTADGTDIFRGIMPDEPDDCVAVIEYPGEVSFINNTLNRSVNVSGVKMFPSRSN